MTKKEHKGDEWCTPQPFFEKLDEIYNFDLDPCSTHENAKCRRHYTKEEDGLVQEWFNQTVFCNPPYSNPAPWIEKAYRESQSDYSAKVLLLPAATDTAYFADYCRLASEIFFVKGRLKFVQPDGSLAGTPRFGSCVVVFKRTPDTDILKPPVKVGWVDREFNPL